MTVTELQGATCIPLERIKPKRKQIMRSRNFNSLVSAKEDLIGALTLHAQECGRTQHPQHHVYPCIDLEYPRTLIRCALRPLDNYYRSECLYKRAGLYVEEVISEKTQPENCLPKQ